MFSPHSNDFTFVEFDGVMVMQFTTSSGTEAATLPLDAVDAELLNGFDVQQTGFVQLGKREMEQFANPFSRYLREDGQVTKVYLVSFANRLLKELITAGVAMQATWRSPSELCGNVQCSVCHGTLSMSVCQATILAKMNVSEAFIGLAMLVNRGSLKLDEEQEYFWPTQKFLERLCKSLEPGRDDEILYKG